MTNYYKALAGIACLTLVPSTALAADMTAPMQAPPAPAMTEAPPAMNWTGFYAGAYAGYQGGDIDIEGCTGFCPDDPKLEGALAGIQFGYDHQFANNLVAGVFGQIPLLRPDSHLDADIYQYDLDQNFTAVAAARVGYAMNNWLPYAFGGVEFTEFEITDDIGNSYSDDYTGLVAGLGVEYAVTRNVSFDLRYTYSDLSGEDFDFGGGPEEYSANGNAVTIGVNYRF